MIFFNDRIRFSNHSFNRIRRLAAKNGTAINKQPSSSQEATEMVIDALPESTIKLILESYEASVDALDKTQLEVLQRRIAEDFYSHRRERTQLLDS